MQKIIQLPLQYIQSNLDRENFAEDWLEEVAESILEVGTLLTPLVVERVEENQYIVLIRDLEFLAALKASEMDASFTHVNAYVVESEQQLSAFETQLHSLNPDDDIFNRDISDVLDAMTELLNQSSQSSISKTDFDALKTEFSVHIFSLMQAIEQNGSQFNSLFEVLGEIDHQVEQTLAKVSALTGSETKISAGANPIEDFIQTVNNSPLDILERKLKSVGANKVLIDNLIAARNVEHFVPFSNLDEMLEVKGVGDKSLLKIISHWK